MSKWFARDTDSLIWVESEEKEQICVLGLTLPKPNGKRRNWVNLIAAAPDLYETLEAIRDVAMNPDNRGQMTVKQQCKLMDAIYKSTTKVLAKARGESHE